VAWNTVTPGFDDHAALFETRDGGFTWETAQEGLPDVRVRGVAIDPLNGDRMYLSLNVGDGFFTGQRLIRLFRRTDRGAWRERPIFPFDSVFSNVAAKVFVASSSAPCPTGEPFPTVFAGPLYSCDGGESWQETNVLASQAIGSGFEHMAFDPHVPGRIYATERGPSLAMDFLTSSDHGRSWTTLRMPDPFMDLTAGSLVHDPSGRFLYAADLARGFMRSEDGGQTWNAVTSNLPAGRFFVPDLASDPVDPAIAYVALEQTGVFKTTDGGETWQPSSGQLHVADPNFRADKVVVHPLARNLVFAGSAGINEIGPMMQFPWASAPDSGTTWARLAGPAGPVFAYELAADPLAADGWLTTASGFLDWPSGGAFLGLDLWEEIFNLQMVPDAARTVVVSSVGVADGFSGRTALLSFRELLEGASPPSFQDIGLLGRANVVYDSSDGTHRLFVSGKALQRDPHLLYRAALDDVRAGLPPDGWEPLVGDGVFPGFQLAQEGLPTQQDSFATLLIDPVGGGQTMYTLGSENTLWESRDGGRSWRRDDSPPGFVTAAWLSPVDGALYATISPTFFAETSTRFWAGAAGIPVGAPGRLWKRAPSTGMPPGTRIERGELRVQCQGPAGFAGAITPGSTFPIGDTPLRCSATDAFGNVGAASFTVSVLDTTRPVLTVPPDITLTAGCSSPQNIGTATATDAASAPVNITSNRPSIFRAGITVVTYTARDARGNTTTGTQRVTVILGDDPSCCPAGTSVRRGTSGDNMITGTPGRDCILGLGGHDSIDGGGGDDVISGGQGNDILRGSNGGDQLFGGGGNDRLEGGSGDDTLNGGANNDICIGGSGANTVIECSP
jgi:hypothetical protein